MSESRIKLNHSDAGELIRWGQRRALHSDARRNKIRGQSLGAASEHGQTGALSAIGGN